MTLTRDKFTSYKIDYPVYGTHIQSDDYGHEQMTRDAEPKATIHVMITPITDTALIEEYGADISQMIQCIVYDTDIAEHDRIEYRDNWYEAVSIERWNTHSVVHWKRI